MVELQDILREFQDFRTESRTAHKNLSDKIDHIELGLYGDEDNDIIGVVKQTKANTAQLLVHDAEIKTANQAVRWARAIVLFFGGIIGWLITNVLYNNKNIN